MEVFREKKFTPTSNALLETQKPNKLKFSLVRIKDLLGNSHFNTLSLVFGKCMKISLSSGTWIIVNKRFDLDI